MHPEIFPGAFFYGIADKMQKIREIFISRISVSEKELALQGLLNSNCNGHGHTDHGVVASAQEAHHFHVCGNGGGTFACGITVF